MKKQIDLKLIAIITGIVFAVIVLFVAIFAGANNKAVSLEEQISSADSQVNVLEKRRMDLIFNLVDTVQAAADYEQETLTKLTEARALATSGNSAGAAASLIAIAENYPELKANENYLKLMDELSITENGIAQARKNYNEQVKAYNKHIRSFPNSLFLGMMGYEPVEAIYTDFDVPEDAPSGLFKD